MAENVQGKLQKAGSELSQAKRHVSSIREMGEGHKSFLDLFEALQATLGKLMAHGSDAYDHIAQAYKSGQMADQALLEAGFEAEADQADSKVKLQLMVALKPAIESIEGVETFATERSSTYNEALSQATKASSILQMRAVTYEGYASETQELIDKYPLS